MRKNYIKSLLIGLISATAISVSAQDFQVDGIYYTILTDATVEVAPQNSTSRSKAARTYSGDVAVPSEVTYDDQTYTVTGVGKFAFCGYSTSSPSTVTSVSLPETVTYLGEQSFIYCTSLTSIDIPSAVTSIGVQCFRYSTALSSVTLPDGLETLDRYAFGGCTALTSINIPSSITTFGASCFASTGLESITFTNADASYDSDILNGCSSLTSITLPEGMSYIPNGLLYKCTALTDDVVNGLFESNPIDSISNNGLRQCTSLTTVVFPDELVTLNQLSFYYCTGLTSITLKDKVETIGKQAFGACDSITTVISLNPTPPAAADTTIFDDEVYENATLYVADETAVEAYKAAEVWKKFTTIAVYEETSDDDDDTIGISNLATDGRAVVAERLYNLAGQEVAEPDADSKSIYVVVKSYDDGSTDVVKEAR